jgi:O-antigen/teichoic acid export membrane protein
MKQLYKNISFTSMHQLIVTGLAFILVPVATRYLGLENFGVYTLATTIGFFVSLIADLGISTILTREISKKPHLASKLFSRVLSTKLVLTILAVIFLLIALKVLNYPEKHAKVILVFSISAVLGSFSTTAFGVFRGFERMQYEAVGVSFDKIISVTVGITLLVLGFGLEEFIWSFVVSGVFLFLYSFFILYKKFLSFELKWHVRQSAVILKISIFLGVSAFLSMAYNYLDIIMLSKMVSDQDIGYYGAAYRVLAVTRIFPTILVTAFLPQLSAHHTDRQKLSEFFTEGVGYLFLIIFPLIPAVVVLAEPIMYFICGAEFMTGGDAMLGSNALRILAFAIAAQIMNIFFVPLYVATNHQRKIVHFQIVGLVVNVGLNLLLIPSLSIVGAAIATVATEMAIFLLIFYWIRKKLAVKLFPAFAYSGKVFLSTIVMMLFIAFAVWQNFHILLIVGVALLVYTVTLEVTNTLKLSSMAKAIVSYKSGV